MAINFRCPICKKTWKLDKKKCTCGLNLKTKGKYKVRVRLPNGKWLSKQVDNLKLAQNVEAKFRTQRVELDVFDKHIVYKIDNVWKKYIRWAKVHKRSWHDDETRWTLHVAQHVKNKPMNQITPQKIEAILDDMRQRESPKKKPYAPATIKQVLVLIRRVFNWASRNDLYNGVNPANKVDNPKFDNQVTNPVTKDDLNRLLDYLNSWDNERAALLIKFALFSGRRRGEILHMKWEHVQLDAGYVTFPGANTKNGKSQTVPMNQTCTAILKRCHELKLSHWVFPSSTGAFYITFNNTWKYFRNRLKWSYRFHDLRHSFASYLASSGEVDIYTLQHLLGHKDIKMTQRYAHLINGALQKGSNVADKVFM